MGWHADGRASIVFGTHTHVPTADARVLPGGTAYISDVGMTGPYDGVLGRRKERVLYALTTSMPTPFNVATGDPRLCGILVKVDAQTGKALSIERVEVAGLTHPEAEEEGDEKEPPDG
jgi:calcineurin-like phosphoesterase